jgi:DNA polymerase III psi subunit
MKRSIFFAFDAYQIPDWKASLAGQQSQHEVLVLCKSLSEAERLFLSKVLSAVKLDLVQEVDCWLIPQAPYPSLAEVQGHFVGKTILAFGFSAKDLSLHRDFPSFASFLYEGKKWLLAPGLSQIESQAEAKKNLWEQLKQLFSV